MQKYECTWEKLDKCRYKCKSDRNWINAETGVKVGET
jgi:hypothetical protein